MEWWGQVVTVKQSKVNKGAVSLASWDLERFCFGDVILFYVSLSSGSGIGTFGFCFKYQLFF